MAFVLDPKHFCIDKQKEVSVSVDENSVIFFVKVLDDLRKVSIFIPMRHGAALEFKNHSFLRWPLNICP